MQIANWRSVGPSIRVTLSDAFGKVVHSSKYTTSESSLDAISHRFQRDEIKLWWSVGMGEQVLYTFKVEILDYVSLLYLLLGFGRLKSVCPGWDFD